MIKIKNNSTGEIILVNNANKQGGKILAHWKSPNPKADGKFFASHPFFLYTEDFEVYVSKNINCRVIGLAEGYELINERTPNKTQPKEKPAKVEKPAQPVKPVKVETPVKATEEPKQETKPQPVINDNTGADDNERVLLNALKALRGNNTTIDEAAIIRIFDERIAAIAQAQPKVIAAIAKRIANDNEVFCEDFDEICDYIANGQPVYMYGAAGCGKSHTAEQVANALGLDYYTQSQVLFAHDVKGYGDANGNYQETPFFKAFTKGGLFFIDEMDASAPEALVVLNTAIANRAYDFPIIGNVRAHENFRIIAAGNTALTGADVEYTARSVQDASTINRFAFFKMQYDKRVELPVMAKGDEVLYNFVCDLRKAIEKTNIQLCVSYRQTQVLSSDYVQKYGKEKALMRNVFGGREEDDIRSIYGELSNTQNIWAKAMRNLFTE